MGELVLIALLAAAIGAYYIVRQWGKGTIAGMEPLKPMEFPKGEPAEEGALIPEGEPQTAEAEPRKAA